MNKTIKKLIKDENKDELRKKIIRANYAKRSKSMNIPANLKNVRPINNGEVEETEPITNKKITKEPIKHKTKINETIKNERKIKKAKKEDKKDKPKLEVRKKEMDRLTFLNNEMPITDILKTEKGREAIGNMMNLMDVIGLGKNKERDGYEDYE